MSKFPTGAATPASIVDALKAIADNPLKVRASFASGQCVRGTYAASDRAEEITGSQSFVGPSRVLARFAPRTTPDDPLLVQAIEDALG